MTCQVPCLLIIIAALVLLATCLLLIGMNRIMIRRMERRLLKECPFYFQADDSWRE
jgi:hypothetical protein